jgi:hypothetical protein
MVAAAVAGIVVSAIRGLQGLVNLPLLDGEAYVHHILGGADLEENEHVRAGFSNSARSGTEPLYSSDTFKDVHVISIRRFIFCHRRRRRDWRPGAMPFAERLTMRRLAPGCPGSNPGRGCRNLCAQRCSILFPGRWPAAGRVEQTLTTQVARALRCRFVEMRLSLFIPGAWVLNTATTPPTTAQS